MTDRFLPFAAEVQDRETATAQDQLIENIGIAEQNHSPNAKNALAPSALITSRFST